jgi:anhydro-N-acetylmuramic acid kinase
MIYRAIGTMSGSSMDGLDLAYCVLEEIGGKWTAKIEASDCLVFDDFWKQKLQGVTNLNAKELLLTHTAFGKWMGNAIASFIEKNNLHHKIHLIASHGHTVFHEPALGMTFQMGDGAAIATTTSLPVVTDLRNMDVALGGQGAPIVPIAEKLLWQDIRFFLNLGGIANVSIHQDDNIIAYDICSANRVLNLLAQEINLSYDANGELASSGKINAELLELLDTIPYYKKPYPKSLANEMGTEVVYSILQKVNVSLHDKLATYCHHIARQIAVELRAFTKGSQEKIMITGGGAFNKYLIQCIQQQLQTLEIEVFIPEETFVNYKEAMAMALIGILRWREEDNVLASVTGASRNSVGGALWMGQT